MSRKLQKQFKKFNSLIQSGVDSNRICIKEYEKLNLLTQSLPHESPLRLPLISIVENLHTNITTSISDLEKLFEVYSNIIDEIQ